MRPAPAAASASPSVCSLCPRCRWGSPARRGAGAKSPETSKRTSHWPNSPLNGSDRNHIVTKPPSQESFTWGPGRVRIPCVQRQQVRELAGIRKPLVAEPHHKQLVGLVMYTSVYIHPSIRPSVRPCMHACMHTYVHTYIHAYVHTYIHTHTTFTTHTHRHRYEHTCKHT